MMYSLGVVSFCDRQSVVGWRFWLNKTKIAVKLACRGHKF